WIKSLGRRPLRRLFPKLSEVRILKHLRSAQHRFLKMRLREVDQLRLEPLLRAAVDQAEEKVRQRLRPILETSLHEVGLEAQNLPERVARQKLVEELLDRVCERYFLAMGDLRDAISRNNLKLPDFRAGDPLLAADRRLRDRLAGVYRGGE